MECNDGYFNYKKWKERQRKIEYKSKGFKCSHCRGWVAINNHMGTMNRNHCNACLWSKHVDEQKGDRKAKCHAGMRPIGLTFKHEGIYKQGELMLVHKCNCCEKISINRIAGDDDEENILRVFNESLLRPDVLPDLKRLGVLLLAQKDESEIHKQLFGVEYFKKTLNQ